MRTGGEADGHGEADSRFSQFCERAQKPAVMSTTLSTSAKIMTAF
jgi:hypothetical protein